MAFNKYKILLVYWKVMSLMHIKYSKICLSWRNDIYKNIYVWSAILL